MPLDLAEPDRAGDSEGTCWRRRREPVCLRARWPQACPRTRASTATDLNQPMLDHAAARQRVDGRIAWQQADALALPFGDRAFDIVACQFGVMFFPDKVQGYREARRVLRPGGRFLFNVWDRIAENVFADVVTEALASVFPHDPPRFMARTPHGHHDVGKIREELAAAGFASIAVETVDGTSRAASARDVAIAYCQGTPLRNEIEARDPTDLEKRYASGGRGPGAAVRQRRGRRADPSATSSRRALERGDLGLQLADAGLELLDGRATSSAWNICGMCCGQLVSQASTSNRITCSGRAL